MKPTYKSVSFNSFVPLQLAQSRDGTVHISRRAFERELFTHYFTTLEPTNIDHPINSNCLTGICEWVSTTKPTLSLSFDWKLSDGVLFIVGKPYYNFTIFDEDYYSCLYQRDTLQATIILNLIDRLNWEKEVFDYFKHLHSDVVLH